MCGFQFVASRPLFSSMFTSWLGRKIVRCSCSSFHSWSSFSYFPYALMVLLHETAFWFMTSYLLPKDLFSSILLFMFQNWHGMIKSNWKESQCFDFQRTFCRISIGCVINTSKLTFCKLYLTSKCHHRYDNVRILLSMPEYIWFGLTNLAFEN